MTVRKSKALIPQTASHANTSSHDSSAEDVSELRLTLRPSLLRSAVNRGTRIITLQELSKAVAAAYIERTIRGTNPRPSFDVWAHNLSVEATQGKASAVADKRIAKPLSQGLLTQGLVVK